MVSDNVDLLPVVDDKQTVIGVVGYKDILGAYKMSQTTHLRARPVINVKRRTLKLLAKRQQATMSKSK